MEKGILYVVATPIGNLDDITLRAIKILQEVDLIAAEDTRHTLKLLNHLDISKPLISYHRHNEEVKSDILIEKLKEGQNIALVSDAGTPGICDPGEEVIKKCIEEEINVVPIPGACAMINSLICSGLNTKEFTFLGFLPLNKKLRKNKLEEISKTYVKSENNTTENTTSEDTNSTEEKENNTEETNTTSENSKSTEKKITMKIDDDEIMSTSFDEAITTGKIQLSVGQASTDSSTVQGYVKQAQNVATVLDTGKLPVKYDVEKNQYVLSNISKQDLIYVAIAMAVVTIIGIIVLIVKYKTNGLLAGISYIGLSALYLIVIRYTNVTISIDSIFAIGIILILNYIFIYMLLSNIRKMNDSKIENVVGKSVSETYKKFFMRIIPICVVVITFCFASWIPMNSFGMTAFWGIAIIAIYNAIITNGLLRIKNK